MFRKDLRRSVIFGRNDLVQDAPISRIDLLVCRNTLMYFNAETQARSSRFHFALNDAGYLFLGKAEMLLTHGDLFMPVDLKRRIFAQGRQRRRARPRLPSLADRTASATRPRDRRGPLRDAAFEPAPVAQLVVDRDGPARAWPTQRARALFGLGADRPRAAAPGPRALLPAGRAALAHRAGV